MTFTVDLTTNIGQVRLILGDTVQDAGPKPDGTNFSDEELQVFLGRNDHGVDLTSAEVLETLARMWASQYNVKMGPVTEDRAAVSEQYEARAMKLREKAGGAGSAYSVGFNRNDGYAAAAEGTEYYGQ